MPEPSRIRHEGDIVHFNERHTSWSGTRVYNSSFLYGDLYVDKSPDEPFTPNIHTDGNVTVEKDVFIRGKEVVDKKVFAEDCVAAVNLNSRKNFDIAHPSKSGWRLRHTCLEGPENGVYLRGRLTNQSVIELPDYWTKLVDAESMTVTLTQIGYSQDLIVEKIEWGKNIIIKSGLGVSIDCYYVIFGERKDGEKLIVEYEGNSPNDYPGNNDYYSIVGYNYDTERN